MTPAEQLAAARANVVGSYLPARLEWLERWCGPCLVDGVPSIVAGPCGAGRASVVTAPRAVGPSAMYATPIAAITLDPHHPEVRDHLVRLGCPEWARDVPAAVWAWGTNGSVLKALPEWNKWDKRAENWSRIGANDGTYLYVDAGGSMSGTMYDTDRKWIPWWRWTLTRFETHFITVAEGQCDTIAEAMAAADLSAIHAGCILREYGGWLVPMPDGGIGFFEEVNRDE